MTRSRAATASRPTCWASRGSGGPTGADCWRSRTATATWLADFRFDVDWDAANYLDDGDALPAPALVFHGDADDDVPLATSQEFEAANPDAVTLVEVAGAGHIQSWNMDPAAYESRLLDFLSQGAN